MDVFFSVQSSWKGMNHKIVKRKKDTFIHSNLASGFQDGQKNDKQGFVAWPTLVLTMNIRVLIHVQITTDDLFG